MDIYFSRYPGGKKYMNKTKAEAKKKGYVETLYGRRLYLPRNFYRECHKKTGCGKGGD
ncbi:MAG: hypothetical protein Ct9H300mP3_05820 [Gammaproteobacteria bacterium]|nr:MAG: hypothetical protein Ct9H300mP3_05820 [Gammaproteobacteria bacterium]